MRTRHLNRNATRLAAAGMAAILAAGGCTSASREPGPIVSSTWDEGADRPPTAPTLYSLARMFITTGRDVQAESVLLSCRARYPHFRPAVLELAGVYARHGKVDDAIAVLDQALRAGHDDPVMRNDLGMCLLLKNEYEQALDQFSLAAAAAPDDARFKANAAMAAGMIGRDDEALALYREFLTAQDAEHNLALLREARSRLAGGAQGAGGEAVATLGGPEAGPVPPETPGQ